MASRISKADICIYYHNIERRYVAACIEKDHNGYVLFPHEDEQDEDKLLINSRMALEHYELKEVMFCFSDYYDRLKNMKAFSLNVVNHYPPDYCNIDSLKDLYDGEIVEAHSVEIQLDPQHTDDARNFYADECWIHFGNIIMSGETHSFFEKACRRADALNAARDSVHEEIRNLQQTLSSLKPPTETKSEEIIMTESAQAPTGNRTRRNTKQVLEQVATVAQQSAKLKLQKDTGEAAIEIAISRISKLLPEPARKQFEVYVNNDLGKAAVAYLLLAAQLAFMPDSKRLEYISTGAVIATTDAVGDMLPIKQMVIDLFSSLPVPPEASE